MDAEQHAHLDEDAAAVAGAAQEEPDEPTGDAGEVDEDLDDDVAAEDLDETGEGEGSSEQAFGAFSDEPPL